MKQRRWATKDDVYLARLAIFDNKYYRAVFMPVTLDNGEIETRAVWHRATGKEARAWERKHVLMEIEKPMNAILKAALAGRDGAK